MCLPVHMLGIDIAASRIIRLQNDLTMCCLIFKGGRVEVAITIARKQPHDFGALYPLPMADEPHGHLDGLGDQLNKR